MDADTSTRGSDYRARQSASWSSAAALWPWSALAQRPASEDQIKAVFLFNFAKYVDWPQAPAGTSASIRMCVPANPDFLSTLRAAVQDEVVNGRPLTAIDLDGLDAARDCDILYVGNSAEAGCRGVDRRRCAAGTR